MSLRSVRREFREEVLKCVAGGKGNLDDLLELADAHFGANQCGYKAVLKAFLQGEVNMATSFLRNEGEIESVGRHWKQADELNNEDIAAIQLRRKKRVRGELSSGKRMAHDRGDVETAALYGAAMAALGSADIEQVVETEDVVEHE